MVAKFPIAMNVGFDLRMDAAACDTDELVTASNGLRKALDEGSLAANT